VIWEQHRGENYLVSMDESFFEFFDLASRGGYSDNRAEMTGLR